MDLGGGVHTFQSPLWQTNALVCDRDGEVLLCDPALSDDEIATLSTLAGARPTHILLTHADYDHTCGLAAFGAATVVAGPATAAAVTEHGAAPLRAAGPAWGWSWPGEPRVDRIAAPGEHRFGPWRIEAFEADGHVADGMAFALLDEGVLLPGDYLSAITIPFVTASLRAARATVARLVDAIDRLDLRWVVPGHGPPLAPGLARRIAVEDLLYLDELAAAASEARRLGLAPGFAHLHVYGVRQPRPETDDFAIYGIHASNARIALSEEN